MYEETFSYSFYVPVIIIAVVLLLTGKISEQGKVSVLNNVHKWKKIWNDGWQGSYFVLNFCESLKFM